MLTQALVRQALALRAGDLPRDARDVVRACAADYLACGFAALQEPAARHARDLAAEEGGHPQATLVGMGRKVSALQAALCNGTVGHALDYDDVVLTVPGHMSVAILPAVLALAERERASGEDVMAAFAAGFETACRVGALVEPAHYANGFHATATIGSLGAAMACAWLLRLPEERACHAIGLAATQAAGLKAMFGSMAKPLHAGLAAQAGLRAALLAARGFTSRPDPLECPQGFAAVHGTDFHPERALAEPAGGWHLLANLFKFHAACYSTHSTIEAVAALRDEHGLAAEDIESVAVTAGEGCSICNIQEPADALEAKFSLRAAAAFALLRIDTADLASWGRVTEPAAIALRDRVQVALVPGMNLSESEVAIACRDGRMLRRHVDVGDPIADKQLQWRKVQDKFNALAMPVIGRRKAQALLGALGGLEEERDLAAFWRLCGGE